MYAKMTAKGSFTASAAALSELEVHEMTGAIVGILNDRHLNLAPKTNVRKPSAAGN